MVDISLTLRKPPQLGTPKFKTMNWKQKRRVSWKSGKKGEARIYVLFLHLLRFVIFTHMRGLYFTRTSISYFTPMGVLYVSCMRRFDLSSSILLLLTILIDTPPDWTYQSSATGKPIHIWRFWLKLIHLIIRDITYTDPLILYRYRFLPLPIQTWGLKPIPILIQLTNTDTAFWYWYSIGTS